VTANRLPDSTVDRPLAAFVDTTQCAVREVLDFDEPETDCMVIARLSGHLAAMRRAVYPQANGQLGADGQLRTVCLSRAREVEWTLRLLECQLSGEVSTAGLPATAALTLLAQRLDSYRAAEQALVTRLEDQLATEGREELARKYRRALTRAPTRPHPRSPRARPLCHIAFWLHGRWDRVLDTMDSRPGVGDDFPVPSPNGRPAIPAGEESRHDQGSTGPARLE
jgi:hypothetical protein